MDDTSLIICLGIVMLHAYMVLDFWERGHNKRAMLMTLLLLSYMISASLS